jgi:MFS superfamily sulfate permease-like transporter
VIVRRMWLVVMVVVMIIFGFGAVMVITRMMVAGGAIASVMHLRQQMNPNVINLEREQNGRKQGNPPPARSRAE